MRKVLITGAFLIFFLPIKGIADDSLDVGSFSVGGKLQLDGWAHQLGDGLFRKFAQFPRKIVKDEQVGLFLIGVLKGERGHIRGLVIQDQKCGTFHRHKYGGQRAAAVRAAEEGDG